MSAGARAEVGPGKGGREKGQWSDQEGWGWEMLTQHTNTAEAG